MPDLNIAVIGAGVVGLTTAIELQKELRNAKITLISDKYNADTTSYVAAGIFRPGTSFRGPTEQITRKWITDSYYYWDEIQSSTIGALAGVTQISGYIFSSEHPHIVRNKYIEDLVPIYRRATEDELKLCPGNWKYGSFFMTLLTQCSIYLPWVAQKFQQAGGQIQQRTIQSFIDLIDYDIVVNCSGFGAKFLCNDDRLVPIRGQVVKVRAPWIKTFFYGDYDTYILPGFDNVVTLGGCRQYDSYDTTINKYDGLSIQERCRNLLPSLEDAELIGQQVGLRPHRDIVRVEKEIQNSSGRKLKIVHNYGHGGYGVTTAPGTSIHAVRLVREFLYSNKL